LISAGHLAGGLRVCSASALTRTHDRKTAAGLAARARSMVAVSGSRIGLARDGVDQFDDARAGAAFDNSLTRLL